MAEYFLKDKNTEKKERRVYSINDKGLAIISNKRADKNVLGIYSSSPAFVMKEEYREDGVLIALSGTVEAIYAGDLKPGDEVVSFKEGKVIKANFLEKTLKRSVIVGKVVKIIDKEKVLIKI